MNAYSAGAATLTRIRAASRETGVARCCLVWWALQNSATLKARTYPLRVSQRFGARRSYERTTGMDGSLIWMESRTNADPEELQRLPKIDCTAKPCSVCAPPLPEQPSWQELQRLQRQGSRRFVQPHSSPRADWRCPKRCRAYKATHPREST